MLKDFRVRTVLITFVLVLAVALSFVNYNKEEIVLRSLVGHTGAQDLEYNVTGWVRVDASAGISDPAALAAAAARKLGLPAGGAGLERWKNAYAEGAQVYGAMPGGDRAAVTAQVMGPPGGSPETHLMISVSGKRKFAARARRDSARAALAAFGRDSRTGITVDGRLPWGKNETLRDTPAQTSARLPFGKPPADSPGPAADGRPDLLATAVGMMAKAGADVQERTQGDNLVSLTGHTNKLAGIFRDQSRAVNINVACRHDPVEGATHVYAATPLILIEY